MAPTLEVIDHISASRDLIGPTAQLRRNTAQAQVPRKDHPESTTILA